jgi:hypothetical protein
MRHGAHQGAQKSIRTGIGLLSATALKSAEPASASHGSGRVHFGQ